MRNSGFISVALFASIILALTTTSSAEVVEQMLGPYDVPFDLTNTSLELNSSASKWNDSDHPEGTVYVDLKNQPGFYVASITIMQSISGIEYSIYGAANNLEQSGWENIQTYTRTIDGNQDATLTTADGPKGNRIYWAIYKLNRNTLVDIKSWMPMNKGTGDLLNTIHVAERILGAPAPSSVYNTSVEHPVSASNVTWPTESSAATKQCEISIDRTPGFAEEYMLDQYNNKNAMNASEASDYLNTCIDASQAEIFSAGDVVEVLDHDKWYSATRIWSNGGYWINDGTIVCED